MVRPSLRTYRFSIRTGSPRDQHAPEELDLARQVVGVRELGKGDPPELVLAVSQHLLQHGVGGEDAPVRVAQAHPQGRLLEGRAEPLLARGESRLGSPLPGDIPPDNQDARNGVSVQDRRGRPDDLEGPAVRGGDDEPGLDRVAVPARPRGGQVAGRERRPVRAAVAEDADRFVGREPGEGPAREGVGGTVRGHDPAAGVEEHGGQRDGVERDGRRGQGDRLEREL